MPAAAVYMYVDKTGKCICLRVNLNNAGIIDILFAYFDNFSARNKYTATIDGMVWRDCFAVVYFILSKIGELQYIYSNLM